MQEIIEHLFGHYKAFKFYKTKISMDSLDYPAPAFIKVLYSVESLRPHLTDVLLMSDAEKLNWCKNLWAEMEAHQRREQSKQNASEFDANLSRQFTLYSDWKTGKKIVYDRTKRRISDMHPDTYLDNLSAFERKMVKEEGINPCVETFDPYRLQSFWIDNTLAENQNVVVLNKYLPPLWRTIDGVNYKDETSIKSATHQLPPIAEEFFVHLFPDTHQRRFVYWWIHTAMTGRNVTYLVLNGRKGIGKGVFYEILRKLIGEDYSTEAPVGFLDSTFNSVLDGKRLIYVDEIRISDQEDANKLKRYANKMQNIEKKGVDADKSTETFTNFIISNNDIADMYLEWDDRRFSVPDLTADRLDHKWGDAKVDQLVTLMNEDATFISQVGYFFLYGVKDEWFTTNAILKGERFWQIVDSSMPQWQKFIIQAVINYGKPIYPIADLVDEYRKRNKMTLRSSKIIDFISNYRDREGESLGVLTTDSLKLNPKYVRTFEEKNDDVALDVL